MHFGDNTYSGVVFCDEHCVRGSQSLLYSSNADIMNMDLHIIGYIKLFVAMFNKHMQFLLYWSNTFNI